MKPGRKTADVIYAVAQFTTVLAAALAVVGPFVSTTMTVIAAVGAFIGALVLWWVGGVREGYGGADLARANAAIAEEREQRLRLEERFAPRQLSDAHLATIAQAIAGYSRQKYDIITFIDDPESIALTQRIDAGLRIAGWVYDTSREFMAMTVVLGVKIEVAPSAQGAFMPAAKALVEALRLQGIATTLSVNPEQERFADRIRIKVGKKPDR